MRKAPKWFRPVAIAALLWNLIGCAAYLADVMQSPEAIATLSATEQALRASRPAWSVGATALAVWMGAVGSLGLVLRREWATSLLVVSFAALIVQDAWMFGLSDAAAQGGPGVFVLQGLVLAIGLALLVLARRAAARGWLGSGSTGRG